MNAKMNAKESMNAKDGSITRRDFLQISSLAGVGLIMASPTIAAPDVRAYGSGGYGTGVYQPDQTTDSSVWLPHIMVGRR